ncbi:DUF418 domain-containing protein [Ectobacillus antri]|jgi:uncharacterized protein|uniref:DUF418 domain-containing protein n=1 Tax=Ectobacillus antri TaxID=2486280 RepID=A0ABT6H1G7_9BACI|nr:DUF418 domain-containing protein [Ectobacillus antri]MDG4656155.1 DUF418 domain-containing protein [Ectobacillus antri]MDG5752830.1 DUF418 domain-containing protein [Ectobacillus antri]
MTLHTRIQAIDIIRGFAVFGIFFVNWPSLVGIEVPGQERAYMGIDALVRCLYDLVIQTKFYTMFSFLFGLGFYIFMKRAEEKTHKPKLLFLRRLFLLFIFGTLHFILLWSGDILHSYAIAGCFLLFFYNRKPNTILIWSVSLLSLFMLFVFFAYSLTPHNSSLASISSYAIPLTDWTKQVNERSTTFVSEQIAVNIVYIPETLGLFLLGLYAGKKNIFGRTQELDSKLKKLQIISFLLTLPSWYKIISYFTVNEIYNSGAVFPYVVASGKTLFIFYVVTLLRLHQTWQHLLTPLQYVGRMALTNYLLQTIATLTLFSLFFTNSNKLPLYTGIPFCIGFYMLQAWASKLWLNHFSQGPMEYIWRLGTYGFQKQKSPG